MFADHDYHSVDPLPEEWIEMIREKPDQFVNQSTLNDYTETMNTNSQLQSSLQNINSEIDYYSKRKVMSQQKPKRKAYYS